MENRNGCGNGQLQAPPLRRPAPRTQPQLSPSTSSRLGLFLPPLLGLASGLLLWQCYFPVAWGWLAWVALVPLLCLARREMAGWKRYAWAWLTGLYFFVVALQWMRVADDRMYFTWIALSLYCSLFVPAGIYLVRRLDQRTRLPLVVTLPAAWAALEYFRAHVMTGFPWYFLGYSQHAFLPVCQIADLGGPYMVTFLVAAVNAVVFDWLCSWPWFRRMGRLQDPLVGLGRRRLIGQTGVVLAALGAALAYGGWRLSQDDFAVGPRVALIQGNLDQRIRNEATAADGDQACQDMVRHYATLTTQAASLSPRPDLIVWPETSYPAYWVEEPGGQPDPDSQRLLNDVVALWKTNVLLGLNSLVKSDDGGKRKYNSALLVSPNGAAGQARGRYDKIHRVPFGEYVPLRDWLPWMNQFAPYDFDYSIAAGESLTRFPLGERHFGVLICYEDTDPYLARQYVRRDGQPAADFLLNISNDGWFIGTSEHEEHLAICRFRAIESRRAVARAVNMGVSAIIDGNGRVLQPRNVGSAEAPVWEVSWDAGKLPELPLADWAHYKKVAGVLVGAMPIDHRFSLYAAWGDWLPQACYVFIGIGLIWSFRRPACRLSP